MFEDIVEEHIENLEFLAARRLAENGAVVSAALEHRIASQLAGLKLEPRTTWRLLEQRLDRAAQPMWYVAARVALACGDAGVREALDALAAGATPSSRLAIQLAESDVATSASAPAGSVNPPR